MQTCISLASAGNRSALIDEPASLAPGFALYGFMSALGCRVAKSSLSGELLSRSWHFGRSPTNRPKPGANQSFSDQFAANLIDILRVMSVTNRELRRFGVHPAFGENRPDLHRDSVCMAAYPPSDAASTRSACPSGFVRTAADLSPTTDRGHRRQVRAPVLRVLLPVAAPFLNVAGDFRDNDGRLPAMQILALGCGRRVQALALGGPATFELVPPGE